MTWHFPLRSEKQMGGNSLVAEFFGSDRKVRTQDFVRESIQNSIDAKRDDQQTVSVIFTHGELNTSDSNDARDSILTSGFQTHLLESEVSKTKRDKLTETFGSNIKYLLVEDLYTTGLNGPLDSTEKITEHTTNALTCFFRLNGQSGKSGAALGSFGVGRHVFYSASKHTTFFVLTTPTDSLQINKLVPGSQPERHEVDPKPMLLGMSLQQSRDTYNQEGRPERYDNYLLFGTTDKNSLAGNLVLPYMSGANKDDFVEHVHDLFGCKRSKTEPGTSIIVLFPHLTLSTVDIRKAVVNEFALPILREELRVRVDGEDIDSDSIISIADTIDPQLGLFVRFLHDSITENSTMEITANLEKITSNSCYDEHCFQSEDELLEFAQRYRRGELVAMEVSLGFFDLEQEGDVEGFVEGGFKIFLQQPASGHRGKKMIARSGLVIRGSGYTDKQFRRDYYSFLDLTDDPLGNLLRRAEGPAHDEWKPTRIEDDALEGPNIIRLVREAAKHVTGLLMRSGIERDRSIFADLISFPATDATNTGSGDGGGDGSDNDNGDSDGDGDGDNGKIIINSEKLFQFDTQGEWYRLQLKSGSTVKSNDAIEVKLAYDTRVGSPFSKWRNSDFDLQKIGENQMKVVGAKGLAIVNGQTMRLTIVDVKKFELRIPFSPFDPDYDLRIRAERLGSTS